MSHLLAVLDHWQRRHRAAALAYAVVKKFGDDNANQYVVALGWYGFVAIYPLLLVVITIFGFIGAASLGHSVVSTLHEFPVVGTEFNPASSKSLQGSDLGLVIGLVALLYGAQGVTQTVEQAMAGVWHVPQIEMPGFASRLARSLIALGTIGGAFVVNASIATIVTNNHVSLAIRVPALVAMTLLNLVLYTAVFWVTTPSGAGPRELLVGAALASLGFTFLITLGSGLVQHQLRHSSATYGQFGLVIGLVGFLFLLAKISLYGAELNPVLVRHLWPRGITNTDPTEADDQVLSGIVLQMRRREDQVIAVRFGERAATDADPQAEDSS
jgi:uncharacterized BrkB/YihY/UPF0761 family membrane protein